MQQPTNPQAKKERDDLVRVPGLFRRWELGNVIEAGRDVRLEEAGTTSDGTELFAVYVQERNQKDNQEEQ
jgi:hypothetical protein